MKNIKVKNPINTWKVWSKKKKIISSVIAVILICVLVVSLVFRNKANSRVMPQITVSEATVTVGNISNTIVGTGTLQIDPSNSIKIPESITIKEVKVESGDAVSKGDTLAVVDKASVLEAMETIQEEIESLDEEINEGDDVDETTTIKATVSGTIKKIYAKEGDSVVDCITEKGALIVIAVNGDSDNTIEVVAGSGAISDISVSKNEEVSKGDTLLTIENDEESTSYKKLIEQRKELAKIYKTLTSMSKSGTIVSDMEGIVGSVNVSADSSSSSTTSGSSNGGMSASQMSTKTSSTSTKDSVLTNKTEEKIVKSENTGVYLVTLSATPETSAVSEEKTILEEITTVKEETTKDVEETTVADKKETTTNNKTKTPTANEKQSNNNSSVNTNVDNNVSAAGNSTGRSYSGTMSAGSSTVAASNTQTTTTESDDSSYSNLITAFTLASNDTMLLSVSVDELDINSVAVDQEASVTLDAIEDQTFIGTVTKVSNSSSSSGSGVAKYTVEITIPKDEQMKPGMNASATIVIENKENILILPITALQEKGDQSFVYISKDSEGNLSGEVAVTTGLSDGDNVEITEGLSEGDTVYYQKTGNTSGSGTGFGGMFGGNFNGERPEGMGEKGSSGFGGRGGSGEMPEMPQGMPGGGN